MCPPVPCRRCWRGRGRWCGRRLRGRSGKRRSLRLRLAVVRVAAADVVEEHWFVLCRGERQMRGPRGVRRGLRPPFPSFYDVETSLRLCCCCR